MKLSKILCDSGMKLPFMPQLYRFCMVKPMCHVRPIQAMRVEKRAISNLLTTTTSMDCGTESPIASYVLAL